MLFVDHYAQKQKIDSSLITFTVKLHDNLTVDVDVNEDNLIAWNFYLKYGFKQIGKSQKDSEGRNFPIIHLKFN